MRLDSFFSGAMCVMSGGRLPEALFMVFLLDSKGAIGFRRCKGKVSCPGPCASSGGRLPEALFMVFLLDSKGAKVCKSCRYRQELSNEDLVFTCKHWRRYSRERASQSLTKLAKS